MEWIVYLPIITSIALTAVVFVLIYKIPPKWVTKETDNLKSALSPTSMGDAIHHAACKNDYELMNAGADFLEDMLPKFSKNLMEQGINTLGVLYQKGYASNMGKSSGGAAKGFLELKGFQKHAAKAGLEGIIGGILPEALQSIPPEVIQGFLSSMAGGANNGPGPKTNMGLPPSHLGGKLG